MRNVDSNGARTAMGGDANKLTNKLKILTKLFRIVEKVDD